MWRGIPWVTSVEATLGARVRVWEVKVGIRIEIRKMTPVTVGLARSVEPHRFLKYVPECLEAHIIDNLRDCGRYCGTILVEKSEGESGGAGEALGQGYLLAVVLRWEMLVLDACEAHHSLVH